MKTFPTLFKKTSTGAIQYWKIDAYEKQGEMTEKEYAPMYGVITTRYGQIGTENEQLTNDFIYSGKNLGKKNATTVLQQAEAEALAKWEKQKKKGYVESIAAAEAGQTDALIEGGILPMLAHKFADHSKKIKYPAYVQPKLDGIRCIAILKDGKCTLWSRTRKQITSMPHIIAEIEAMNIQGQYVLDGELYNHALKSNFERIVSMVRQEEAADGHTDVEYHIYDLIEEKITFEQRWRWTEKSWDHINSNPPKYLKLVETRLIEEDSVTEAFRDYRNQGYEGAILRNAKSLYVNKRSYDLQKVKEFDDNEFKIIGIDEGRGKLTGHVGSFICLTSDGKEFLAKMSGDTGQLKRYFEDHSLWTNKILTVQYQGLTGSNGVPRFPVGIAIRDYE
jgi:DNA ligase 1